MCKFIPGILIALMMLSGCAARSSYVNVAEMPDTFHCEYMQEICQEAAEYESRYLDMTPEEQEDAKSVLDAYKSQCDFAVKECRESGK